MSDNDNSNNDGSNEPGICPVITDDCIFGLKAGIIGSVFEWCAGHGVHLNDPKVNDIIRSAIQDVVNNMPTAARAQEITDKFVAAQEQAKMAKA